MIIEELERLVRDYHTHYVLFVDDDFFWKKSRAMRFCELVIQKKLPICWATSTRPDSIDDELLKIASEAGCTRLAFGFESGSQRVLNVLKKRSDIDVNLTAAHLCHRYNIDVLGLFMVGNPTETKKDLQLTWEFIKKAKVNSLSVSVLTPFPGTQLWKQCEERGYIKPDIDFSTFYFTYGTVQIPDTFPPYIVEKFKRQLLIKAYLFNPNIRKKFLCRVCQHPILTFKKVLDYIPFLRKISPSI
ncbi:MAG: hypothetical protein A2062_06265 [Omnitrophica WOR_2 bacterium GWA2_44_7]|nr:MAG: hypothetical protein A2062_06265 [Omnitrophica WOR_2 bacterium GWA2_44_7]